MFNGWPKKGDINLESFCFLNSLKPDLTAFGADPFSLLVIRSGKLSHLAFTVRAKHYFIIPKRSPKRNCILPIKREIRDITV